MPETVAPYAYEAFISYCHADAPVARLLHRALEDYRVPRSAGNSSTRKRIGRVFRDYDELRAGGSLEYELSKVLGQSRFLIVVCSRNSVKSTWIPWELEKFLETHSSDHVLPVLVDGNPDETLPASLMREGEDKSEPLALDLRADSLYVCRKKLRVEKLRLLATMLDCSFDDLRQRNRERKVRRTTAVLASVAAFASMFSAFALWQNTQIDEQYRRTLENESLLLAERSAVQLENGDRTGAMKSALQALPQSGSSDDRPYVSEAEYALCNALAPYGPFGNSRLFMPRRTFSAGAVVNRCVFSTTGAKVLASLRGGAYEVFETETGELLREVSAITCKGERVESLSDLGILDNGVVLFRGTCDESGFEKLLAYDFGRGEVLWQRDVSPFSCFGVSDDGKTLCVVSETEAHYPEDRSLKAIRYRTEDWSMLDAMELPKDVRLRGNSVALSSGGGRLAVMVWPRDRFDETSICFVDFESEKAMLSSPFSPEREIGDISFQGGSRVVALFDEDSSVIGYDSIAVYDFDEARELWSTCEGVSIQEPKSIEAGNPTRTVFVYSCRPCSTFEDGRDTLKMVDLESGVVLREYTYNDMIVGYDLMGGDFGTAVVYLREGQITYAHFLGDDSWIGRYLNTFKVKVALADAEFVQGKLLILNENSSDFYLFDNDRRNALAIGDMPGSASGVKCSHDGSTYCINGYAQDEPLLMFYDAQAHNLTGWLSLNGFEDCFFSDSDDALLYIIQRRGKLSCYDVACKTYRSMVDACPDDDKDAIVAHAGDSILACEQKRDASEKHFVLRKGQQLEVIDEFAESFEGVRLRKLKMSQEGGVVAVIDDDRNLTVLLRDEASGVRTRWGCPERMREQVEGAAALSPDGSLVAAACEDGRVRVYETERFSLVLERDMGSAGSASAGRVLGFSPSGDMLVFADATGDVEVVDMESGLPRIEESEPIVGAESCEFFEDGRLLSIVFSSSESYGLHLFERQEDGVYRSKARVYKGLAYAPARSVLLSRGAGDELVEVPLYSLDMLIEAACDELALSD